jgi:hypothetical protein
MTTHRPMSARIPRGPTRVAAGLLLALAVPPPAAAALPIAIAAGSSCSVEYGYNTGNALLGTYQNLTTSATIASGQTLTVNRARMNYIRNVGTPTVKASLSGAPFSPIELAQNGRDPQAGSYLGDITLVSLECLTGPSQPTFGSAAQLIEWYQGLGESVGTIAGALKDVLGLSGVQATEALRFAGFSATVVANAVKSAFGATNTQVGTWLRDAGYPAEAVATALRNALGYSATAAASWLAGAFNATGQHVTHWLRDAGYSGAEVAAALKDALNATAEQARQWLEAAFNAGEQMLAQWLEDAGYPALVQTIPVMVAVPVLPTPAQLIAQLKDAGAPVEEIVQQLRDVLGMAGDQIAAALRTAGFAATESAAGLRTVFGAPGGQLARWLADAGYAGEQVARALKAAFDTGANQIRTWMSDAFNATNEQLATWLLDAGYPMEIDYVLIGESRECRFSPGSWTGVPPARPTPIMNTGQAQSITLRGNVALPAATSIDGLDGTVGYSIAERGQCFVILNVSVPPTVPAGTDGIGTVRSGRHTGGQFEWQIHEPPPEDRSIILETRPPSGQTGATGATLSNLTTLSPANGQQCLADYGSTGYAGYDQVVVGLSWVADPAAATLGPGYSLRYEVQILNNDTGVTCPTDAQALEDPNGCTWLLENTTETARPLPAGANVSWRVRSILIERTMAWPQSAETGPWTAWQTFRVAPRPHPPALVAPVNNFLIQTISQNLNLEWQANPCPPSQYEVEVRRVVDGIPLETGQDGTVYPPQTSHTINLTMDGTYTWRVRTLTSVGASDWSASRTIRKTSPTR